MAGEWEETTLGAEVDLLTGFPFKSERYTDSSDSISLVRGDNIVQGAMRWDGVKRWPLSERGEHELYELREGDIVLAMDRPWIEAGLKYAAISKHDLPCLLVQRTARLRGGPTLDTGYLRYLVGSREFTQHIHAITTGTAVPHISGKQIKDFVFTRPSISEQKAIAAVLGALDDKIELNRRMNATLEAMARALFQSWFVDFDPVRAKLDARLPAGLDQTTSALFPEHLEDSPLGHIPQGWEVKTVGEIGNVICGKTPLTAVVEYYGDDVPFITIPDMHGNVFGASTARKLSHAGANSQANKTLPPGSICVSCIATPGLVVITSEKSQTNQQINSVVPHVENETYFWYWVMTGLGAEIALSGSGGSVLTNLSKGRFETLKVIRPPHDLIAAFHSTVSPLFQNILANTHQSRTLATLRDTLLPKLLSGQLSIEDGY